MEEADVQGAADWGWGNLSEALRKATLDTFKPAQPDQGYERYKEERMALLRLRRGLRARCSEAWSEELQESLKHISKQCTKLRQAFYLKQSEDVVLDIWQAWKEKRFAEAHRPRLKLGGQAGGQ